MTFSNRPEPHSALSFARQIRGEEENKKDTLKILDRFIKTSVKDIITEVSPSIESEKPACVKKYIQSPDLWDVNVDVLNSIVSKVQSLEKQGVENQTKIAQLMIKNEQLANELKKHKPWQSELIHWIDSNKILVGVYLIIPGAGWGAIEFMKLFLN